MPGNPGWRDSWERKGTREFFRAMEMCYILIVVVVTQVYTFVKSPNLYLRYVCFIEDAWYWFIGKEMRVRREETKGGKKKKKSSHFCKLKHC